MRQVVVGGSVAALVAADRLSSQGVEVDLFLGDRPGGGFAPIAASGRPVELGCRLIELSYDQAPAKTSAAVGSGDFDLSGGSGASGSATDASFAATPPLSEYQPGPHGHRPYVHLVDGLIRELLGDRLVEIEHPLMDIGSRWVRDWILSGDLTGLADAAGPKCDRFVMDALSGVGRWGERGWFEPEHRARLETQSLREASESTLGAEFNNAFLEPVASRVLERGTADVVAALHRKIWLPLFWPGTVAASLSGVVPHVPNRPFHSVSRGGMGALVTVLLERLAQSDSVRIFRSGALQRAQSQAGMTRCEFADGRAIEAQQPILGVAATELFAAANVHIRLEMATTSLVWVEMEEGSTPPDVLWTAGADRPVYRWSRSYASDGAPIMCGELAWWVREQDLAETAVADMQRSGIIDNPESVTVLGAIRRPSFAVPSLLNMNRFAVARQELDARSLQATLIGGIGAFGADTCNEQIVQGLAAAESVMERASL